MSKRSRHQKGRRARRPAGIEPGPFEIEHAEEKEDVPTSIRVTTYDANHVEEQELKDVEQLRDFIKSGKTAWVRVQGLKDSVKIKEIADVFEMHHLAVEDVLDTHQRAQVGQFGDTFFLITHLVENHGTVAAKQLSLFFNRDY